MKKKKLNLAFVAVGIRKETGQAPSEAEPPDERKK
jgi:hypothetical protein